MFTDLIPGAARAVPAAEADARERFLQLLATAVTGGTLQRLMLSQPTGTKPDAPADLERLLVRPVRVKALGEAAGLQLVWRHRTRDLTKNHDATEALALIAEQLGAGFGHAHLDTTTHEVQLAGKRKGGTLRWRLQVGKRPAAPATQAASADDATIGEATPGAAATPDALAHNRSKQRPLDITAPCWQDLGLADAGGRLLPTMARKWKQINRYTEIFAGALAQSPLAGAERVRVVDFGCGKAYLTFAMHQWLVSQGRQAEVTGVELRQELVTLCEASARRHGHTGLRFDAGDVRAYAPPPIDVMVALHACDTATDHAIHLGLRAGAAIIMCSPCCHKELRGQLRAPEALRPLLRHGVHLGQEAEMVTDGLRALLLEAAGYDTQVFEFVALEHTNKNKMILAVKRERQAPGHTAAVQAQIAQIKAFYGIREQCLDGLLGEATG